MCIFEVLFQLLPDYFIFHYLSQGYEMTHLCSWKYYKFWTEFQRIKNAIFLRAIVRELYNRNYPKIITISRHRCKRQHRSDAKTKSTDNKAAFDLGYNDGVKVLIKPQIICNASKQVSSKLAPKRDGPYTIQSKHGPASYVVQYDEKINLAIFHTSH